MSFKLSSFFTDLLRDGTFSQTDFASSHLPQSLCFIGQEQFLSQANKNPNISCIITNKKLANRVEENKGLFVTEYPQEVFYKLHNDLFQNHSMIPKMEFNWSFDLSIHPSAVVSKKTFIGKNVKIGAGVIIEDYTYLGDNVCIDSGAIIGASGHYYKNFDGKIFKVEHAGGVWLNEGAQVLSGAVISKSLHTDFTRVGSESIISINAHIGHGCNIGKRCTITGNVQIAGFTKLGDDVWVGPSATIGNLRTIGDRSKIEIGSVVIQDVDDDGRVSGNFAQPHNKHLRAYMRQVK